MWKRNVGCGLWMVWLLAAVFAGEWVLLLLALKFISRDQLPACVFSIIALTIVVGWIAVYFRIQRRAG